MKRLNSSIDDNTRNLRIYIVVRDPISQLSGDFLEFQQILCQIIRNLAE
jgi:hypothetical protein